MAYNLADRFPKLPKYYPLLDPGTYESIINVKKKVNTQPFFSTSPRITNIPHKMWTQVIYSADRPHKLPNCSVMQSRVRRFPYGDVEENCLKKNICECGLNQKCECSLENVEKKVRTEQKFCPRIFKGLPPRPHFDDLSKTCTKYKPFPCYNEKDMHKKANRYYWYDKFNEAKGSTDYYKGCRWSHWTSKRNKDTLFDGPGPTTYTIKQEPTQNILCAEKIKATARNNSKHRFIEMVQPKKLHDYFPGPATYTPKQPKGTELQFLGPKAKRFVLSDLKAPGPSDYKLKRDFDLPEQLEKPCKAVIHKKAAFGVKANRFKSIKHESPGPTSYDTCHKNYSFNHCPMVPFGSSSIRFAGDYGANDDNRDNCFKTAQLTVCEKPCLDWMFKSKSLRMFPLKKKYDESSPADIPLKKFYEVRSPRLQKIAPFGLSQPRFQPWYNWIPIYDTENTPGPGEYKQDRMSCLPAVSKGPVIRTERFKVNVSQTPPCNAYKVVYGVEQVLNTYNKNLKSNVNKKPQYRWKGLSLKKKINDKERESLLISFCISLLNTDIFDASPADRIDKQTLNSKIKDQRKTKMLRCFMYKRVVPYYY